MTISIFYILSIVALLIGTAAIYMPLIDVFSVSFIYYHYFIRKPINWIIFFVLLIWTLSIFYTKEQFPDWTVIPLVLSFFAVFLTYKMHQENAFKAVNFPDMETETSKLPLSDEMQLAVIEYDGVTKCYPLDYVIHHHIINDIFNSRIVALTYCAMCRSIIPFDVTETGPLFVASFKNANMIVADRKTKTFFQQATFKSIIGKLHPGELNMIPFQILSWEDILKLDRVPEIVKVSHKDFKDFQLPIPGLWKRIIATEKTPGLSLKHKDQSFPARTRVIGITDKSIQEKLVYIKKEVLNNKIVKNKESGFFLIGKSKTVNGFKDKVKNYELNVTFNQNGLTDLNTETNWDIRGKYQSGIIKADLEPIALSDEYWFSWKNFHKTSRLIRL